MTRTGKIARLPHEVREELNRRLRDGEPGPTLLAWLNADEEVREVLQEQFGGQPINKQNLSDWRLGGFRDWQRHQESLDLVRTLSEQGDELLEATRGEPLSDRLAAVLATELVRAAQAVLDTVTDPAERWRQLRELRRELSELRKDDHRAGRLKLDRDEAVREDEEREQQAHAAEIRRLKDQIAAPLWAALNLSTLAKAFGGGEAGFNAAAIILETRHDLPIGSLRKKSRTASPSDETVKPSQGESNPDGSGPAPAPTSAASADSVPPSEAAPTAESEPEGSAPAVSPSQPPAIPPASGEAATSDERVPAGLTTQKPPDPGEDRPPETVRDLPEEARPRKAMPPPPEPAEQRGFVQPLPVKTGYRREWKRTFRQGPLSGL